MRATPARWNWSLSCRRALMMLAGVVLAGAAWADADQPSDITANQLALVPEGSSPSPPENVAAHPTVTNVSAETPRGGNGGDDRRLFMLMMLGQVVSGGPLGRLGQ